MDDGLKRILDAQDEMVKTAKDYRNVVDEIIPQEDRPADSWPKIAPEAFHGLAGDLVRVLEPHTEADPVGLLASTLAEFGVIIGREPHLILDGSRHPLVINPVLVGTTSKGRKGSADKRIKAFYQAVDISWSRGLYKGTLSSGEGLVWAVRDPRYEKMPVKDKGRPTGEMVDVCVDEGIQDKRLFLVQQEFGVVLRVMSRDGNSLSGVIRDGWDGEDLAPMTKGNRIRATNPHIGIIGHVTKDELLRHLTDTEASNGFGNRFMWLLVRRSKELPFPAVPKDSELNPITIKMRNALEFSQNTGQLNLTQDGNDVWAAVYHALSADRLGLAGAILNRSEAYVMRLSALYALLDCSHEIDAIHLQAALALWEYCEKSTHQIFGDKTGDAIADVILDAVRKSGGMTDTQIYNLFSRNVSGARLSQAKAKLRGAGLIKDTTRGTDGRSQTLWEPVTH